jgi:hypothetical protein
LQSLLRSLTAPERAMEVCDICGVFINSSDNEQRRLVSTQAGGPAPCCAPPASPADSHHWQPPLGA